MNFLKDLWNVGFIQLLMIEGDSNTCTERIHVDSNGRLTISQDTKEKLGIGSAVLRYKNEDPFTLHLNSINEALLAGYSSDFGEPVSQIDGLFFIYYHKTFKESYLKLRVRFNGHSILLMRMPFQGTIEKDLFLGEKSPFKMNALEID